MKVAIDTGPLTSGDKIRGVGFYTKNLIAALEKLQSKDFKLSLLTSEKIKESADKFDIVHIPYFNPYFLTVPTNLSTNIVVTIHDTIPLLYPDHYPAGLKGRVKLLKQKHALKSVSAVITDTEASKKDIVRFLGMPASKVTPTILAAAPHFKLRSNKSQLQKIKEKYNLPNKFVLYVGDVNYNKNISILLQAAKKAKMPVVVVGKQAAAVEEFSSDLSHLHGPRDWVRFLFGKHHPEMAHYIDILTLFKSSDSYRLGFVPDEDLVAIYNLATVYCQPSLAEGFGLPVVEAFAAGTPVVISKTQALVEVANGAALIADVHNSDEFAKHFRALSSSAKLRNELKTLGHARSKELSWGKTALETLQIYENVYSSNR